MVSELIVIIDASQKNMDEAWSVLARGHVGQLFRLTDMALIRRDKRGEVSIEMRWQESDRLIGYHKRLAGDFAEAIFGFSSSNGHRRLTEAGIDPIFLQDVSQALKPNGLSYLFFIPAESRIDTRRFIESLEPLGGDLYHTTVPAPGEETFSKAAQNLSDKKLE